MSVCGFSNCWTQSSRQDCGKALLRILEDAGLHPFLYAPTRGVSDIVDPVIAGSGALATVPRCCVHNMPELKENEGSSSVSIECNFRRMHKMQPLPAEVHVFAELRQGRMSLSLNLGGSGVGLHFKNSVLRVQIRPPCRVTKIPSGGIVCFKIQNRVAVFD